jgi:hypothetical protein
MVADHTEACFRFNQSVYAWVEKSSDLKNVFLVSTWMQAPEGSLASAVGQDVDVVRSLAVFESRLAASVARLKSANKTVYLWGPVPGAKAAVPKALALSAWRGVSKNLEITREEHRKQFGFFYDAVGRQNEGDVRLILPSQVLCSTGTCRVVADGFPLYFDNAHMASTPSNYWSRIMEASEELPSPR